MSTSYAAYLPMYGRLEGHSRRQLIAELLGMAAAVLAVPAVVTAGVLTGLAKATDHPSVGAVSAMATGLARVSWSAAVVLLALTAVGFLCAHVMFGAGQVEVPAWVELTSEDPELAVAVSGDAL